MKTKSKNITVILLVCIGAILTAAAIGVVVFANHKQKQQHINNPIVGNSPAVAYCVGASKNSANGNIKYISLKNSVATLSFTNETTKEWEPKLEIQGLQSTGETMYYMDILGEKSNIYTLTNKDKGYESEFLLYDALKYTVDGRKSDSCIIPPDGKEHIVEIDYSYLKENDIKLDSELYIDGYCFFLGYDDLVFNDING